MSLSKVLWSELLPYEFHKRMELCPIVYLPLGINEPHGQISAYGLDTIKAEYLCEEAARRFGGIVAPSLGYHIHESGYHAPWLELELCENNPHMTAMPPHVVLYYYLYQLRAFVNAGFRGIVVISGHSGGNQLDLRAASNVFTEQVKIPMWVGSDPELVNGLYEGDHAGKYEISQLMYLRPELVDFTQAGLEFNPDMGGRLALGADADQASSELGEQIMEASLQTLQAIVANMTRVARSSELVAIPTLHYDVVELMWQQILAKRLEWRTSSPYPTQKPVSDHSRWKSYEYYR